MRLRTYVYMYTHLWNSCAGGNNVCISMYMYLQIHQAKHLVLP